MANIPGRRLRNPNRSVEIHTLQLCSPLEVEDGSPHQDKSALLDRNVWQHIGSTDEYNCLICDKSMTGEVPAVAHANSLKHIRKLGTLSADLKSQAVGTGGCNTENLTCPEADSSTCQVTEKYNMEVEVPIIEKNPSNLSEDEHILGSEFKNSAIWDISNGYTCLVCNKAMSGVTPAQAHCVSFKHAKKVEEQKQLSNIGSIVVSEPISNIPETSVQPQVVKLKSILKNGQNYKGENTESPPETEKVIPEPAALLGAPRRLRPRLNKNVPLNEAGSLQTTTSQFSNGSGSDHVPIGDVCSQTTTEKDAAEASAPNIEIEEPKSPDIEDDKDIENVDGDFYKCLVCLVTVSGKSNMKVHLAGRLHTKTKNLRPRSASNENDITPPKKVKQDFETKLEPVVELSLENITKNRVTSKLLENVKSTNKLDPKNSSYLLSSSSISIKESNVEINTMKSPISIRPKKSTNLLDVSMEVSNVLSSELESDEALKLNDGEKGTGQSKASSEIDSNLDGQASLCVPGGTEQSPFPDYVTKDGTDYSCSICKIFCSSQNVMLNHLNGKKHMKTMQKLDSNELTLAPQGTSIKNRLGVQTGTGVQTGAGVQTGTGVQTTAAVELEELQPVQEVLLDSDIVEVTIQNPQEVVIVLPESQDNTQKAEPGPVSEIDSIRKLLTFGQFVNIVEPTKEAEIQEVPPPEQQMNTEESISVFNRLSSDDAVESSVFTRLSSGSPAVSVQDAVENSDDSDGEEKYERFDRVSSRCDSPVPEVIPSQISTLSNFTRKYERPRYPPPKSSPYVQSVANSYMQPQAYVSSQAYIQPPLNTAYGNSPYGGVPYRGSSPYGPPAYSSPAMYGGPSYGRVGQPTNAFSSVSPGCLSYSRYAAPPNSAVNSRLGPKLM